MDYLREQVAKVLGFPSLTDIASTVPLQERGLDSLMAVEFRNALVKGLGVTLPATLALDYPTLDTLCDHLLGHISPAEPPADTATGNTELTADAEPGGDAEPIAALSEADAEPCCSGELQNLDVELETHRGTAQPVKQALLEIRRLRGLLPQRTPLDPEPIASLAWRCASPAARVSPEALWDLLAAAPARHFVEPRRNAGTAARCSPRIPMHRARRTAAHGGFLADADQFDADFFGISPREAESMDPQQRFLLELTWEALEHALIAPTELVGTPAGVFIGLCNSDYGRVLIEDRHATSTPIPASARGQRRPPAGSPISSARAGPALVVDTACSSSLVALHLACASLRASANATWRLSGGANLILAPETTISLSHARMLSPDGRCKTFDADADGYVRARGLRGDRA